LVHRTMDNVGKHLADRYQQRDEKEQQQRRMDPCIVEDQKFKDHYRDEGNKEDEEYDPSTTEAMVTTPFERLIVLEYDLAPFFRVVPDHLLAV
jgi:hypothetical protein